MPEVTTKFGVAAAKPSKTTKTYQAFYPSYNLTIDNSDNRNPDITVGGGVVQFRPVTEPLTGKVFGEFNTGNPNTLLRFNVKEKETDTVRKITSAELQELIENSTSYESCIEHKTMGVRGIWDKEAREAWRRSEAGAKEADPTQVLGRLSSTILKSIIEEDKGKYRTQNDGESDGDYHTYLVGVAAGNK